MTNMSCPSPQLVIPQTPELYKIQSCSLKNNLRLNGGNLNTDCINNGTFIA